MTDRDPTNDYYVYVLLDPSKGDRPFYIGKGRGDRVKDHYAYWFLRKNITKNYLIRDYRNRGLNDKYMILESGLTEQEALEAERQFIDLIGRKHQGGHLYNCPDEVIEKYQNVSQVAA